MADLPQFVLAALAEAGMTAVPIGSASNELPELRADESYLLDDSDYSGDKPSIHDSLESLNEVLNEIAEDDRSYRFDDVTVRIVRGEEFRVEPAARQFTFTTR